LSGVRFLNEKAERNSMNVVNKKTESILSIQNNALEKLAQGYPLAVFMDILTRGFEKIFIGAKCSVLLLDEEKQRLHCYSSPSLPKEYIDFIDGTKIGPSAGSCGTAVYRGEVVIVEDIATDPLWVVAKDIALSYGLASCWSCPIGGSNNKTLGTYAVYHSTSKIPEKEELDIIKSMAYLAGVAIENKKNEDKLLEGRLELESRVEQRTEEMKRAKEAAEKANRAKTEFLSRMSHELRTPMNAILGFTQLLQMDSKNPLIDNQKKSLEQVSSAGHHLLELINEVLELSKIESGLLDLALTTVNITPILENVISISQPLADEKGISLEYSEILAIECFARVDPLRFKEVILNLISNAIKYNKPNGSVVIFYEKQEKGYMRLGVKDSGYGITDKNKDKLFKPFERFDVAAKQIEGTGIGLTIAKQLIELMGGAIGYESVAGEGSLFYIDVPVSDEMSESLIREKRLDSSFASSTDFNEMKILYIEDIPANVDLVKQILAQRKNIEFLSVSNAFDGIEIAKAQIPDLILMDIHLPGMDGLTAFEKLQGIKETQGIPVIALTADAMDGDIKKALEMGFKRYITKPIDVIHFFKTIDEVLDL
jgi:signal transduction histidine kinase